MSGPPTGNCLPEPPKGLLKGGKTFPQLIWEFQMLGYWWWRVKDERRRRE